MTPALCMLAVFLVVNVPWLLCWRIRVYDAFPDVGPVDQ